MNAGAVLAWARYVSSGPREESSTGAAHGVLMAGPELETERSRPWSSGQVMAVAGAATGGVVSTPGGVLKTDSFADELEPFGQSGHVSVNDLSSVGESGVLRLGYHCRGVAELADQIDAWIADWMRAQGTFGSMSNECPNLVLSITSPDGRLVMTRGYTNEAAYEEMGFDPSPIPEENAVFYTGPTTQMRIASVTKTLTALAVQRANANGELGTMGLDTPVSDFFRADSSYDSISSEEAAGIDALLGQITVDDLLRHHSGWNSGALVVNMSYPVDETVAVTPQKNNDRVAVWTPKTLPVTHKDVLNYALAVGYRYRGVSPDLHAWLRPSARIPLYNNLNYFALGRVLGGVDDLFSLFGYAFALERLVAGPLGMDSTFIGGSAIGDRRLDEAPYINNALVTESGGCALDPDYDLSMLDSSLNLSLAVVGHATKGVLANRDCVYQTYGARNLLMSDSSGGVITSALDMARYLRDLGRPYVEDGVVATQAIRCELFRTRGHLPEDGAERGCSWNLGTAKDDWFFHKGGFASSQALVALQKSWREGDFGMRTDLPVCEDDLDDAPGGPGETRLENVGRWGLFVAINTQRSGREHKNMVGLRRYLGGLLNALGDDDWGTADGFDWFEEGT